MSTENGTYVYACPMPPFAEHPTSPVVQPGAVTVVVTEAPSDPNWQAPTAEDDLDEAERLFLCAVRRVRKAIRRQREAVLAAQGEGRAK